MDDTRPLLFDRIKCNVLGSQLIVLAFFTTELSPAELSELHLFALEIADAYRDLILKWNTDWPSG